MKNTWRQLFRRLAAGCIVSVSATWSSAMCYAATAYDDASDPVYADGWQGITHDAMGNQLTTGDNGGTGFSPWNFDSSYFWPAYGTWRVYTADDFHAIDNGLRAGTHYSNPFNNIGKAWDLGNATTNIGNPNGGPPRAGRGFAPLEIGQTLSVVIDNPTKRQFFKGYFVSLSYAPNGVNGNFCNGQEHSCTPQAPNPEHKMRFQMFEYFTYGQWSVVDYKDADHPFDGTLTGKFDTDTAAAGSEFSVKRTGADTYDVRMHPLGGGADYTASRTFSSAGKDVNWIEFTFFNTVTDTGSPPTMATDFYIRSIAITDPAPPGVPGDYNNNGKVDAADYVLWRNGGPLQNEVDAPGTVNAADYAAWKARFGNTSGAGASLPGSAAPEPGTFVLLFGAGSAGAISVGLRRKPRNRQG